MNTTCNCGKAIAQVNDVWMHVLTNKVDCFNAAIYVGFFAQPKAA